jgi:hypothetical protein
MQAVNRVFYLHKTVITPILIAQPAANRSEDDEFADAVANGQACVSCDDLSDGDD